MKVLFSPESAAFLQKNADISEIKEVLVLKGLFSESTYLCVLTYQIEVSSMILSKFRQALERSDVIYQCHTYTGKKFFSCLVVNLMNGNCFIMFIFFEKLQLYSIVAKSIERWRF